MVNDKEEFNEIVQQILGTNSDDKSLSLTDKHSIDKVLVPQNKRNRKDDHCQTSCKGIKLHFRGR